MITWLAPLAAMAAVASPPALPPLPADQLAAAQRLVLANPPTQAARDNAVRAQVEAAADRALAFAKVTTRTVERWNTLRERLRTYYAEHLLPHRAAIDQRVMQCLVEHYAGMPAADIDAATAFFSTPSGHAMWPVVTDGNQLYFCTSTAIYDDNLDYRGGMIAVGLKPPPLPDPRIIMY